MAAASAVLPQAVLPPVDVLLPPGADPDLPQRNAPSLRPVEVLLPPAARAPSAAPVSQESPEPRRIPDAEAVMQSPSDATSTASPEHAAPLPLVYGAGAPGFDMAPRPTPMFGGEAEANRLKQAWEDKTRRRARNNAIMFALTLGILCGALYGLLKLTAQGP